MTVDIKAIAVFAHNEERNIIHCLDSLPAAGCPESAKVVVLANGCTDRTAGLVAEYARMRPNIVPLVIAKGDKANAWNTFVHEHMPDGGAAAFVDGDVVPNLRSIALLANALETSPRALVASAVPSSGRSRRAQVEAVVSERGVLGNLYAVREELLARIRREGIRMPIGFVREDGLIGALAKWDLDPTNTKWDDERVVPVQESTFSFGSIPVWTPAGWRLYFRRRVRYSIGHFETAMLRRVLKTSGAAAMPRTVEDLYAMSSIPRVGWRGIDTPFDWLAARRIRKRQKDSGHRQHAPA
jgi:glycosyltransferase involved in cell wall biosynthesis